ncbi:MAG: hypothetical protein ACM3S1_06020 [Hyphomicrobiales bacterium]
MYGAPHRAKPPWLQLLAAVGALLLLTAVYLLLMRLTIDVSHLDADTTADDRDLFYLGLHSGVLLFAAVAGFALGKWLNGLGLAYSVLFAIVLAVCMVGLQVGSQELACHGHNDLIRHWECG